MILTSATHPNSECATETAKKYVRVGASPRAGQALISAAKVLALIKGRFNVAYSDINELAYPVLRHRIKLNFEAVAERVSADEVIGQILEEVAKKQKMSFAKPIAVKEEPAPAEEEPASSPAPETNAEEGKKKKRGFFGKK